MGRRRQAPLQPRRRRLQARRPRPDLPQVRLGLLAERQEEIEAKLRDPKSDYYLDPEEYRTDKAYEPAIQAELEDRDYYVEKNVFWVPALARWKTLQDSAKLPPGTEITVKNGKTSTYKITSTGKLIDDALEAIEKENPRLKNVLNKTYTQLQIDPANLAA